MQLPLVGAPPSTQRHLVGFIIIIIFLTLRQYVLFLTKIEMAKAHSSAVCYTSTLSAKWILIGCCTVVLANAKASLMNVNMNIYPVQFQLAIK